MAASKPFPSLQEFLFNTPLYVAYGLSDGAVAGLFNESFRIDGHCPYCRSSATFIRALETNLTVRRNNTIDVLTAIAAGWDPPKHYFLHIGISCARKPTEHTISFVLLKSDKLIQKIGQYPSLADIANDESKAYRAVLSEQDSQELHKAIGLSAHGVGIGSYVYLRRIFERLIDGRFKDFKDEEGWSEQEYRNKRMPERIELLRRHLPEFLVDNRKIYNILSLGIHELAEDQALAFFPVLKASIILILEEDEEKRKKLELKKQLKSAVEKYTPSSDKGDGGQ
jgi:hypothetical protein